MLMLPFMGYSLLTTLLSTVGTYHAVNSYRKRKSLSGSSETADSSESVVALIVFAVYIGSVFYFTGSGALSDLLRDGFEYRPEQINLTPFSTDTVMSQYILNVALFVPLGILLPVIWPQTGRLRYILAYGLSLSLVIELSQLLNYRVSDVDDLLVNVLGALIGFTLLQSFRAIRNRSFRMPVELPEGSPWKPVPYLCGMALGYFLLYNDHALLTAMRDVHMVGPGRG